MTAPTLRPGEIAPGPIERAAVKLAGIRHLLDGLAAMAEESQTEPCALDAVGDLVEQVRVALAKAMDDAEAIEL